MVTHRPFSRGKANANGNLIASDKHALDGATPTATATAIETQHASSPHQRGVATAAASEAAEAFDSPELRALKALKWASGRALTAHVQDVALRGGKRAMVATSGGSFKKFVCSSETPCRWVVNAVRTRPRARKKPRLETDATGETEERDGRDAQAAQATDGDDTDAHGGREAPPTPTTASSTVVEGGQESAPRKYWYISSAYLLHTNCTGMAKPTARQLKDVAALKQAVQHDTKISSAALVDQLKSQARLLCSKSMAYKAKIDLLDEMEAHEIAMSDPTQATAKATSVVDKAVAGNAEITLSTQRLPSYLARLSALNPDVFHAIERHPVSNATFYRAIVALDPVRFFSNATPLVFGVDSDPARPTFNGEGGSARLVLLGCDGNLETITFATAHVPEATEEHFAWFLSKLVDCGYPLQRANGVYCDGRWAVTSACARVGISRVIQDTRHLIEDLSRATTEQLTVFHQQQGYPPHGDTALSSTQVSSIWAIQRAESEGEFYAELHKLEMSASATNSGTVSSHVAPDIPMIAAQYLRTLDPRRWALFPRFATSRLYGWQTTRFTPSRQDHQSPSLSPQLNLHLPCEFFKTFSLTLLRETFQRQQQAQQWERDQRVVTPEAERMMQEEMQFVPLYDVAMSAPHIAFVWNPQESPQLRQRRVDLQAKTCTCAVRLQFGVPCRHILSVLRKLNALGRSFEYFDDSLLVRGYVEAHKGRHIELPLDETLEVDTTWFPAKQFTVGCVGEKNSINPSEEASASAVVDVVGTDSDAASSTRKRRARNKPVEERKRAMYKCRKCRIADGHNSLTCPTRPAKKTS